MAVVNFRSVPYRSDPPVTRHRLRDDGDRTLCGIRWGGPTWKPEAEDAADCRLCASDGSPRPLVERCADACRCRRADGRRWVIVRPGEPRAAWRHFYSRDEARAALGLKPAGRHA